MFLSKILIYPLCLHINNHQVSNKQMAETTKRTIRENVSINAQLAKMSDKTIDLVQQNDDHKSKVC